MMFKVNHLVTFTSTSQQQQQTYYEAIKRLQEVEEVIGVWRQKVFIELTDNNLNILDEKTTEVIEHFPIISVRKPEAINYNKIYNNLMIFSVYMSKESVEMHIFDCRSQNASHIVHEINGWRRKSIESMPRMVSTYPVINYEQKGLKTYALIDKNKIDSKLFNRSVDEMSKQNLKVKEKVNAFNQIAIERKRNERIEKLVNIEEKVFHSDNNWQIKPKNMQPFRYF